MSATSPGQTRDPLIFSFILLSHPVLGGFLFSVTAMRRLLEALSVLSCEEVMCDLSDWPAREMSQ